MVATVSPVAYWSLVVLSAAICAGITMAARRRPGQWTTVAIRSVGVVLAVDAGSFIVARIVAGTFSAKTDLPLALCDVAVIVAAAACWWTWWPLVELTWFWGLAGTLQGLLTPDLSAGFTHLVFWQYVVGHAAVVLAAVMLVAGLGHKPRRMAVVRVFALTAGYSALVGAVDAASGANYMFLRRPPSEWTLLRLLGPWPWYIASAAAVAAVLLVALDAPFWGARRRAEVH